MALGGSYGLASDGLPTQATFLKNLPCYCPSLLGRGDTGACTIGGAVAGRATNKGSRWMPKLQTIGHKDERLIIRSTEVESGYWPMRHYCFKRKLLPKRKSTTASRRKS